MKRLFSSAQPDVKRVAAEYVHGMGQLQDEVEDKHDAFLLDPGLGPMTYLTADGRVLLDERSFVGDSIREATDDEAIAALVVGAKKTGITALLELIPVRPTDTLPCPACNETRWFVDRGAEGRLEIVCFVCRGRGWVDQATLDEAAARGTWPLREQ